MTSSFGAQSQLINALSGGGIQFYASQKNATPLDIINSSSFIVTMLGTIIISIVILAAQTSANLQDKTKLDIKKTLAATTAALKQALQQAAASELAVETRRRQWRTLSAAALQEQFKREVKLNVERGTARAHAKYYKGLAETCASNYPRFTDELTAFFSAKIEALNKKHIAKIQEQEQVFAKRTAEHAADSSEQLQSAIAAAFSTGSEGVPPVPLLFNPPLGAAHDAFEREKKETLANHARTTASLTAALEKQTQKNAELVASVSATSSLQAAAERKMQALDDAIAASTSALDARTAERMLQAKKNDSLTAECDALSAELSAAEALAVSQREHFEHVLAEAEALHGEQTAALEWQYEAALTLRVEQLKQESRTAVQQVRLKHSEQSTKLRRRRSSLERALASATSANAKLEASLVVAIEERRSTPDVDAAPAEALVTQLRSELDAADARIEAAAAQQAEHARIVAELEAQHVATLAATIDEHTSLRESSVAALAAQHEETIASAIEAHLTPLKERAATLERERSKISATLDERVTSHEAHALALKAEHDKAIAAAIGELEETHAAERDSLSAALASAQKKPRSPFKKVKLWKKLKTATKVAKAAKAAKASSRK